MSFQHSLPLFRIAAQAISPSVPHLEPIPGGLEKGNIEAKEAGRKEKRKNNPVDKNATTGRIGVKVQPCCFWKTAYRNHSVADQT